MYVSVSHFSGKFLNKECNTLVESDLVVKSNINYSVILIALTVPTTTSKEIEALHVRMFEQCDIRLLFLQQEMFPIKCQ